MLLLNHELSTDYDLEDPWTAIDLGEAGAADGSRSPDPSLPEGQPPTGTLLQGIELPSDTDDSSFRHPPPLPWCLDIQLQVVPPAPITCQP